MKKLFCLALACFATSYVLIAAPANDNFANATAITIGTVVNGTTIGATIEAGEDSHDWVNSVWYKFNLGTAYEQKVTIDVNATEGSNQDAALVVATGTSVDALETIVAQDTNIDEHYAGTFDGDKDYYIGIYSWNEDAVGDFTLTVSAVPIKNWYAAPGGTGSGDSFEDPCDLKTAIGNVAGGNTVYMAPGTYTLSEVGESATVRWTEGNYLVIQTEGVSIIGAGSDQTIILCDQTDDVGVVILADNVRLAGIQIHHPSNIKGNDSWGGPFYSLVAALTVVGDGITLEDVYSYVGDAGGETNPESTALIRPASFQVSPGGTVNVESCAFISEGLLTACMIKPFVWDASEGDNRAYMNFNLTTFKSNKNVCQSEITRLDQNCAVFGNTWYGNCLFTINVNNCVFLNTAIPVGQQGSGSDRKWDFNVKRCFMPEADLEQETWATITYTECDTVIDPQASSLTGWYSPLVKAGFKAVIPYGVYATVLDEDFSSYPEGDIKGLYGWSDGYGSDYTIQAIKDGNNAYVEIHSSGLSGVHYAFDNPVAKKWAEGSSNPYRLWVYSARMKFATVGDGNPWLGFWNPQCLECQFVKDGGSLKFQPSAFYTDSRLRIPIGEWFDFTMTVSANAVDNKHTVLSIGVNGVEETIDQPAGQENATDIFSTLRYFFWGGGTTLQLDSIKLEYLCDGPVNDYLARAANLVPGTTVYGDTEYARIQAGESTDQLNSIWYKFRAQSNTGFEISTFGTWDEFGNDTMLGVFSAETETPTFADLTVVVPLTDTDRDETLNFQQEAGKYYFVVVCSLEGAGGVKLSSEERYIGDLYVAPGGTGTGHSAEDPMGSISAAMEEIVSGYTIKLAPGEYSIADNYNQINVWGAGMTVLCFKVENVTLLGAGPDKTTIVVPAGYVGIRMEKLGASVRDLTVKAYRTDNMPYHYNWQLQGAICACNCEGMSISNVAIYSEQKTSEIRPFSAYSVTDMTIDRLAVEAPYCASPVFFDKVLDVSVKNLTVSGCSEVGNPAVHCANWPWGANEGLIFKRALLANTWCPFTVEEDDEVTIYDSIYYNCPNESVFSEDAEVDEEDCVSYASGVNDPELQTLNGYILTAVNPVYVNVGWHTVNTHPGNDDLANAYIATLGATDGSNIGATVEADENEDHKASVWYKFTPSESGAYRIDDFGSGEASGFDAMLSVYSLRGGVVSFANLNTIVETQDTNIDEGYSLEAAAGTTYYICWDGYDGSQGAFTMHITKIHTGSWYIAPGATGSGWSEDDPSGDLVGAMENILPGQTVNLAPGEYSLADYNNQYDIWGAGMTALCFKVENVTLKGAGPDKTTIIVPPGYIGIRMEQNGASVRDLTVKAYRTENMPYHYNWHMQGAICAANREGASVSNVAVYSEQKTGEIRPFTVYNCVRFKADRVAVVAPQCASPVFFDKVSDSTVNYLTVDGKNEAGNPAVYCGNWPWGVNENLTFNRLLLANTYMPFTVESDEKVSIYDSVYYNCPNDSNFNAEADVTESGCVSYAEGENDPGLEEVNGYLATATNLTYANVGWHTASNTRPGNDDLADAYVAMLGSTSGDNYNATVESGENSRHKRSVWYKFTPSKSGVYRIDDNGSYTASGYDATLSVYNLRGGLVSFAKLNTIVESQDNGRDEAYDLTASSGTTYYICWDGHEGSEGSFTMNITEAGEKYTVTVADTSGGSLTVTPRKEAYDSGEVITLTAAPNEDHRLVRVYCDDFETTSLVSSYTVTHSTTFHAEFAKNVEPGYMFYEDFEGYAPGTELVGTEEGWSYFSEKYAGTSTVVVDGREKVLKLAKKQGQTDDALDAVLSPKFKITPDDPYRQLTKVSFRIKPGSQEDLFALYGASGDDLSRYFYLTFDASAKTCASSPAGVAFDNLADGYNDCFFLIDALNRKIVSCCLNGVTNDCGIALGDDFTDLARIRLSTQYSTFATSDRAAYYADLSVEAVSRSDDPSISVPDMEIIALETFEKTVTIANGGPDADINYTITSDADWLTIVPDSGVLVDTAEILFKADEAKEHGCYEATVTFDGGEYGRKTMKLIWQNGFIYQSYFGNMKFGDILPQDGRWQSIYGRGREAEQYDIVSRSRGLTQKCLKIYQIGDFGGTHTAFANTAGLGDRYDLKISFDIKSEGFSTTYFGSSDGAGGEFTLTDNGGSLHLHSNGANYDFPYEIPNYQGKWVHVSYTINTLANNYQLLEMQLGNNVVVTNLAASSRDDGAYPRLRFFCWAGESMLIDNVSCEAVPLDSGSGELEVTGGGIVYAAETNSVQMTVSNLIAGDLVYTASVTEGADWLSIREARGAGSISGVIRNVGSVVYNLDVDRTALGLQYGRATVRVVGGDGSVKYVKVAAQGHTEDGYVFYDSDFESTDLGTINAVDPAWLNSNAQVVEDGGNRCMSIKGSGRLQCKVNVPDNIYKRYNFRVSCRVKCAGSSFPRLTFSTDIAHEHGDYFLNCDGEKATFTPNNIDDPYCITGTAPMNEWFDLSYTYNSDPSNRKLISVTFAGVTYDLDADLNVDPKAPGSFSNFRFFVDSNKDPYLIDDLRVEADLKPDAHPGNDDLADAYVAKIGSTKGNNYNATVESRENSQHKCSVWYKFTPAISSVYKIDDNGSYAASGYDAMLSVYKLNYTRPTYANLQTIVETQDDSRDETYDLVATAGTTYYICWDGHEGSEGDFTMNIAESPDKHVITVADTSGGSLTVTPQKEVYDNGDEITLTAAPDTGYTLKRVYCDDFETTNLVSTYTVTHSTTLMAEFVKKEYTCTITTVGEGSVTVSPEKETYQHGDVITLTAVPDEGYAFEGFSGGVTSTDTTVEVVVKKNLDITATFYFDAYTLALTTGAGGTVTVEPEKETYHRNEKVTLTAAPDEGYVFEGFTGTAESTDLVMEITMDQNHEIAATFSNETFTLKLTTGEGGIVTVEPEKETYYKNEKVILTAVPDEGYVFEGFTGTTESTNLVMEIRMNRDHEIAATFSNDTFTLTLTTSEGGTVTVEPEKETYHKNEKVTLTAEPDEGYVFEGFTGTAESTNLVLEITMDQDHEIEATFVSEAFTLTLTTSEGGTVTVEPEKEAYQKDEKVTLTAVPDEGYIFEGFTGTVESTNLVLEITMDQDHDIEATFSNDAFTLTLTTSEGGSVTVDPEKETYHRNEKVTLTAVPDEGYAFEEFTGTADSTNLVLEITMDQDHDIEATFTNLEYVVTCEKVEGGGIILTPSQITYLYNDEITYQVELDEGYSFVEIRGYPEPLTNVTGTIVVTKNLTLKPVFKAHEFKVTLNSTFGGSLTVEPKKASYHYHEVVTVNAVPDDGYVLKLLSANGEELENDTYMIEGDTEFRAVFVYGDKKPSGDGSERSPYEIANVANLLWLARNTKSTAGDHSILTADLDLSLCENWLDGRGFELIGTKKAPFEGSFDGNSFIIKGLYINDPELEDAGLFGCVRDGVIKNCVLTEAKVTAAQNAGLLIGNADGCTIQNVSVSGRVNAETNTALLAGRVYHVTAEVVCAEGHAEGSENIAGLMGNATDSSIENAYTVASATGSNNVGGFVGIAAYTTLTYGYAAGSTTATGSQGGIFGAATGGKAVSTFFDSSHTRDNGYGKAVTAAALTTRATFSDWDFINIWEMKEGFAKPTFRGFEAVWTKRAGTTLCKINLSGLITQDSIQFIRENPEVCLCASRNDTMIVEPKSIAYLPLKEVGLKIQYNQKKNVLKYNGNASRVTLGYIDDQVVTPCDIVNPKVKVNFTGTYSEDLSGYLVGKEMCLSEDHIDTRILSGTKVKLIPKGKSLVYSGMVNGVTLKVTVVPQTGKFSVKYTGNNTVNLVTGE